MADIRIDDTGMTKAGWASSCRREPVRSSPASEGIVFNIQRFSLHDGAGIRTLVFLKGCPLRCLWCANPEGQSGCVEIRDDKKQCIGCGACLERCDQGAVIRDADGGLAVDRGLCTRCGACVKVCPSGAKSEWGEKKSVEEIVDLVRRDSLFYRHSGGGVTLGGGEILFQPAFACEVLRGCRELGLNTAIETSGYGEWPWLERMAGYCDTVFFDLKILDRDRHKRITGVDNGIILENLRALDGRVPSRGADRPLQLIIRVPVIPGVNSDPETIADIGTFIRSELHHVAGVELLPFHNFCEPKYGQLGRPYLLKGKSGMTREQVEPLRRIVVDLGLKCEIVSW